MDGTQKSLGVKCWHGRPLSSSKIWWKLHDACMNCDVFHFYCLFIYLFIYLKITLWCVVELLPQDTASTFVGNLDEVCSVFCGRKALCSLWNSFQNYRWRYDWCPNGQKECENLRKWVKSLCAPLRPFISKLKEKYYHSILPHFTTVDVHPYKNILLAQSLQCATKNCRLLVVVAKAHSRATFVRTESLLSCAILKKCFGGFFIGDDM